MFCVAITGGIASGKSTVAEIFREYGIPVVDADTIAGQVVAPGTKAWKKLKKAFGEEVFNQDGTVNKEKLRKIVFQSLQMRRKLEKITHPEIKKGMFWETVKIGLEGHQFVVLDIPLLFEIGEMIEFMHKIIVVRCDEDIQLRRLISRNKISEEEARGMISCQMPLEWKCAKADLVVENSGSPRDTRLQVEKMIVFLESLNFHHKIRCCLFLMVAVVVLTFLYFVNSK